MFEVIQSLFRPSLLWNPVGSVLGEKAQPFLIIFGVIFAVGFVLRMVTVLVSMNPYLKKWLIKMAFILMFFGIFEVLYFLIREQRVAYLSANYVFVGSFVIFVLWALYHIAYRFFVMYRKDKRLYDLEAEHKKYLPKRKK